MIEKQHDVYINIFLAPQVFSLASEILDLDTEVGT